MSFPQFSRRGRSPYIEPHPREGRSVICQAPPKDWDDPRNWKFPRGTKVLVIGGPFRDDEGRVCGREGRFYLVQTPNTKRNPIRVKSGELHTGPVAV